MPKLAISPMAREDLKDIGRYTQRTWGVAQRNRYLSAFAQTFDKLAAEVKMGRREDRIKDSLLSYPCDKHVIFFRRDEAGNVEILRILHGRMDFERHL